MDADSSVTTPEPRESHISAYLGSYIGAAAAVLTALFGLPILLVLFVSLINASRAANVFNKRHNLEPETLASYLMFISAHLGLLAIVGLTTGLGLDGNPAVALLGSIATTAGLYMHIRSGNAKPGKLAQKTNKKTEEFLLKAYDGLKNKISSSRAKNK